ncbi:SpvB/TcaC N-terminal domain-containing protein [Pseudoalteromonas rubra]|uniref:SpvB/TcaC N-terminal domain-containing protein n=1 Tax=Pseudoalteromonas rubra TaxID=43658 RepID=UPI002DBD0D12|nr:SpvB/TcaC N-terminal domain-containing protein [Pseudoalteromonas rubra]MEC4088697.1 SpvB/TcaC N-terminal domain-containing protein [Pseudoalteromonas rubra]
MGKTMMTKACTWLAFALMSGMSASALAGACTDVTNLSFESGNSEPYRIDLTNMEGAEFVDNGHEREFDRIVSVKVDSTNYSGNKGDNWYGDAHFTDHETHIPFLALRKLPKFGTSTLRVVVQTRSETCSQVDCYNSTQQLECSMVVTYKQKTTPYFLDIEHNKIYSDQPVTVRYTAKDDGGDLKTVVFKKSGTHLKTCESNGASSLSCNKSYKANSLSAGNHYWTAIATDKYGNTAAKDVTFSILEPNTPPVISDITIANNHVLLPGDDALVSFSITDEDNKSYNQMDLDTFKINGIGYKGSSHCATSESEITCTNVPISATPGQGSNEFPITVSVSDKQNASVSKQAKVSFNYAPSVSLNDLPSIVAKDKTIRVIASASDASGLKQVKICLNSKGSNEPSVSACAKQIKHCDFSNAPGTGECTVDFSYQSVAGLTNSNEWYVSVLAKDIHDVGLSTPANHLLIFKERFSFAISQVPAGDTSPIRVGDIVTAKIKVAAFSPDSSQLTDLRLTSNQVAQAVTVSPALPMTLPQATDQGEAQEVILSWLANAVGEQEIQLTLTDNTGESVTNKLGNIAVEYEMPTKPAGLTLSSDRVEGGEQLTMKGFEATKLLIVKVYLGDKDTPEEEVTLSATGIEKSYTFFTTPALHDKELTFKVTPVNFYPNNPNKVYGDPQTETRTIVHRTPDPVPPRFNDHTRQVDGRYTLSWPDNADGVTEYYKMNMWPGLPSDKNHAPNKLSAEITSNQYSVVYLNQGQFTYELIACNNMDGCTAGQQITIAHMAPILQSATISACSATQCNLAITGLFLGGAESLIKVRNRATGEVFAASNYQVINNTHITAKIDKKVEEGFLHGGLHVIATNGVFKDGKLVQSRLMVDSTGSSGQPDLLEGQIVMSDNGYLYVGEDTGLAGYSAFNDEFEKLWVYEPQTNNSGRDDIPAKVTARPLVESVADDDHIYFGSVNHQFYKLRHRPKQSSDSLRKVQDWLFTSKGPIIAPAQLDQDGNLYVGSMGRNLYSLDKQTGHVQWQYEFPAGINHQVDVAASGQIYVKTADGELHVIDRTMISANAIKWRDLGVLHDAFREHIALWEASRWEPNQEHTQLVALTKAMLVLLQRAPSKDQLSLLAFLYDNGFSFNEIISALINANPELANADDVAFINTLFKYFLGTLTGDEILAGGDQAYWVAQLRSGATRTEVFIALLEAGAARSQYDSVTFNLLYYFYDYCRVVNGCIYDNDSDNDGLSDRVEIELGTNPVDPADGISAPTLALVNTGFGTVELTISSDSLVEEYELYVSQHNDAYYRADVIAAQNAEGGPVSGDVTTWVNDYDNGEYRFKVKACVRVALKGNPQVLHCSNNFSNEERVLINDSTQTTSPSISLPFVQAENAAPSVDILTAHARLTPTLGSFRVSESGSAAYNVPIELPAGKTGVKPSVSLDYNSQTPRTNIALGWSLSAASSVSRCRQTKAQDGQFKGLTLSDEDRYCLDGQRLIQLDVNESIDGLTTVATFETEIESHQTIILANNPETGLEMFVVMGKDGSYKYYGGTENSEVRIIDAEQQTHVLTWMLQKVTDNLQKDETSIYYTYTTEASNGQKLGSNEKVLSTIKYSDNTVQFSYSATDTYRSSYIDEARLTQASQLDGITVTNHNGFELSDYSLVFNTENNGLRTLKSIAQCRNQICKLPIEFDYTPFVSDLEYKSYAEVFTPSGDNKLAAMTLIDSQGDGTAEVATLEKIGDKQYELCLWEGNTFAPASEIACGRISRYDDSDTVDMQVVDANGDGKQSLWISKQDKHNGDHKTNAYYWTRASLNAGVIEWSPIPLSDSYGPFIKHSKFADFNGDGYADLAFQQKEASLSGESEWHDKFSGKNEIFIALYDPQTNEFLTPHVATSNQPGNYSQMTRKNTPWYAMDVNFDGLADIVSLKCPRDNCGEGEASHIYVNLNKGLSISGNLTGFDSSAITNTGANHIEHLTPADVNGDGLIDLIYLKTIRYPDEVKSWRVLLNRSSERVSFDESYIDWSKTDSAGVRLLSDKLAPMVMDVNKDGRTELYFSTKNINTESPSWVQYEWHIENEEFVKTQNYTPFLTPDVQFDKGDSAFFSDYNRDGVSDLMFKNGDKVLVKFNLDQSPYEGYLSGITQGYVNKTQIHYALMSDSTVYTPFSSAFVGSLFAEDNKDRIAFADQKLKVTPINGGGMVLVSRVETDSPSYSDDTLKSAIEYSYAGAQVQFGGRGMLGFKSLTTVNVKDGQQFSTTTRYHQAYPLSGMPARTIKAYNGTVISSALNDYKVKPNPHTAGVTYQVYNQLAKECTSLINFDQSTSIGSSQCASTQIEQDVFGNVTTTISQQLPDNRNTAIVSFYESDAWRSIDSLSLTNPLSSVTTSNNYGVSDNYKKRGRLVSSTVTHSADGKASHSLTSNFTYYGSSHANAYMLESETIAQGKGCQYELKTYYQYDDLGNLTQKSTSNSGCEDDKQTRISETSYDSEKRYPVYSRQKAKADQELWAKGAEVLTRNAFGQAIEVRTVNGTKVTTLYDVFGTKIGSYSASGAQSYQYLSACQDSDKCVAQANKVVNGELVEKQFMDRMGRVYKTSSITVLGTWLDTKVAHDQYGRTLAQTAPGSSEVTYSYDAFDRVTSTTDNNSQVTTTYTQNDLTSAVELSGAGVSTGKQTTTTTKNALGQIEFVTDAKGKKLEYTYDSRGNQLTVYSSADNMVLIDNSYDLLGRKETTKDVDRGDFHYEYNAFGELTKQTDARGVTTHLSYDLLGRKVRQWHTQPDSTTTNSTYINQTNIVYEGESLWYFGTKEDDVHQLQSATQGDNWAQYYYYDTFGRTAATLTALETQTCVSGVVFNTRLNDLRIKPGYNDPSHPSRDLSDPLSSRCVIQQMAYDEFSRISYQFDDYRKLENGKYIDARGVRNTYQHGLVVQKHEAREGLYGQQYYEVQSLNTRGQVTQYKKGNAVMSVSYDDAGMVKTIASTNYNHIQADSYSFDGLGNLLSRAQVALPKQNYTYDLLNRVTHIENKELFKYSANGNLWFKASFGRGGIAACNSVRDKWSQYFGQGEAPRHAITSRSTNTGDVDNSCGATELFPSSITGSPIPLSGEQLSGADLSGQSASTNTARTVTERFAYDKNGNQTKLYIDGTEYRTIEYTARNKAANITVDGKVVSFNYDANNRRYKRVDENQTIYYVGALELTVSSTESVDNTPFIKRYIGNDAQQKYFMNGNSAMQWMFTDHQGSVIAITNRNYELLARYSYDVFGAQKSEGPLNQIDTLNFATAQRIFDSVSDNFRGYTGHEPVKIGNDSRIIHMNGRIYAAETGRFMQADPVVQAPSNLQNYNAYSYVLNNPLSYTDPSGYWFEHLKPVKKVLRNVIRASSKIIGPELTNIIGNIAFYKLGGPYGSAYWSYNFTRAMGGASSQAFKAGLTSVASAAVFYGIGQGFSGTVYQNGFWHVSAHALAGGILSEVQGGNFGHGFWSAGLTKGAQVSGLVDMNNVIVGTIQSMVIAGTISKLTGGKFTNAAITGAFQYLYNAKGGKGFAKLGTDLVRLFTGDNRTTNQKIVELAAEFIDAGVPREDALRRANERYGGTKKTGYGPNDSPVRIEGDWSVNDMKAALLGHPPKGLGKPDLHHADQMPGSAIHEILPELHRGNKQLHPNKFNQGVTPEMRDADRKLHWWYRAREQGADDVLPSWIYN